MFLLGYRDGVLGLVGGAKRSRDGGTCTFLSKLSRLEFPTQFFALESGRAAALAEAPGKLGLVLQVLRWLAVEGPAWCRDYPDVLQGWSLKDAHADSIKLATELRPKGLFTFDPAAPRASLRDLPPGLFPSTFTPVQAYVRAECGGLIDFVFESLTELGRQPAFAMGAAGAQDYFERGGAVGMAAAAPQEQAETQAAGADCGVCASRMDRACVCAECEVVCCAGRCSLLVGDTRVCNHLRCACRGRRRGGGCAPGRRSRRQPDRSGSHGRAGRGRGGLARGAGALNVSYPMSCCDLVFRESRSRTLSHITSCERYQ